MTPQHVLEFWLDEIDPSNWYAPSEGLDQKISDMFQDTWEAICDGRHGMWLTYPSGALAYILVTDQFSRNMFRGTEKSFASDRLALSAAKQSIQYGFDMRIDPPARQFFYMPLMHSENLTDQERCVRLMHERMPNSGVDNLLHARAHRAVIRQFGRFPSRNQALKRKATELEAAYVASGGYGMTLTQVANAG